MRLLSTEEEVPTVIPINVEFVLYITKRGRGVSNNQALEQCYISQSKCECGHKVNSHIIIT